MSNNTQMSRSIMRTDLTPSIINLQNRAPYGSLKFAPLYSSPSLSGHYRTLRGNGLIDPAGTDYAVKPFGSDPSPSKLSFGKQEYDVFIRRHGLVEVDAVLERDLSADGLDVPDTYLQRHVPHAVAVHAAALASRFSSTDANLRAFPDAFTIASPNFTVVTASLRASIDLALEALYKAGSMAYGDKIVVGMNVKVAKVLRNLLEISQTQAISGFTTASSTLARQGTTTFDDLLTFLETKCDFPLPVELVIDHQYKSNGDPIFADDIYIMIQTAEGKGSFAATPVLDIAPIAGLSGDEASALSALGTPIAQVVEYETYRVRGRGWYIEQLFGLDFYGSSDAQTDRALGVRIPTVLT